MQRGGRERPQPTVVRLRPACFEAYSAESARLNAMATSSPESNWDTPELAVTWSSASPNRNRAPSIGAWQRHRSPRATYAANQAIDAYAAERAA